MRAAATASGASVEVAIAPDVRFGRRTRVRVQPGSENRLTIGAGCRIDDDVTLLFLGGSLLLAPDVEIRHRSLLKIGGRLECRQGVVVGYDDVIHCADAITIGEETTIAEFVSIVDSTHHRDTPGRFYENTRSAPITIGRNVWIAAKATVTMGATIGDDATVAAHAVVVEDVAPGSTVGGVPARVLTPREAGALPRHVQRP